MRSHVNRRKITSFSSDSTLSSDSEVERNGQRSHAPRHRRGYPPSNRTKEHNGNATVSLQSLPRHSSGEESRAKKTVSWNESLRANTPTDVNKQISNEKPRIPPKPPLRTVSRDSGAIRTVLRDSGAIRTVSRDSGTERTFSPAGILPRGSEGTISRDSGVPRDIVSVKTGLRDSNMFGYGNVARNPPRDVVRRRVDDFTVAAAAAQQPVKRIGVSLHTTTKITTTFRTVHFRKVENSSGFAPGLIYKLTELHENLAQIQLSCCLSGRTLT